MAYPPPTPPPTRANNTPQADNHPSDHNTIALALEDIITELGLNPSQGSANLTSLLGFVSYDGTTITFKVGATTVLTMTATAVTAGQPVALASGGITTDVILNGEGVGHRIMLGSTSPYQYFKGGDGLLHWNVDGVDIMLMNPAGGITMAGGPTLIPRTGGFLDISASAVSLYCSPGQTQLIHSGLSGSQGADLMVQNNSVRIAGTTAAETWSDRPLVVTTKAGSGQAGIGIANLAAGFQAQLYVYNQPTLAFDFRNADNTAWVPIRASAFNVSSSAATKANVRDVGPVLEAIDCLRPVFFERDGKTQLGLLAEQVADLVPELVEVDDTGHPALLSVSGLAVLALAGLAELNRRLEGVVP